MKSTNNGSILNFFKPAENTALKQQQTHSQAQQESRSIPAEMVTRSQIIFQSSEPQQESQSSTVKNGKLIIRSSDSEDSNDSDSSLEDLEAVLGRRPATNTNTSSIRIRTPSRPRRTITLDASPIPVRPVLRNSLASLVKQAQKDKKEEATRDAVQALLKEDISGPGQNDGLDGQSLLEDVMAGEEGDGNFGRVMQAMRRQEAGNTESRWFFFGADVTKARSEPSDFPQKALGQCRWKSALSSASKFRQTILSGFVDHLVALGEQLPEELLLWMLDEVCFESRDSIRHSYCRIITSHSPGTILQLMNPGVIQKLFRNMGATEEAAIIGKPIGPIPKSIREYQARSWNPLISLVRLLGSIARSLSTESRNYCICLLARLCMDSIAVENFALLHVIQNAFKSLVTSVSEASWTNEYDCISRTIFTFTQLSTLRLQILGCIPDDGIQRLHTFRRQLALIFYFNSLKIPTQPFFKSLNLPSITTYLLSPRFRTTSQTDYRELSALVRILDVAVADGRYPGLQLESVAAEDAFNQDIDNLVSQLESVSSGIRDASAAHTSRTEAKNAMNMVLLRFKAIRTKMKPRVTIWGKEVARSDLHLGNSEMMERFAMQLKKESGD